MPLASIPSPGRPDWRLGPLVIHAYALAVIAGILLAVVVASRRYRHGSSTPGSIKSGPARPSSANRGSAHPSSASPSSAKRGSARPKAARPGGEPGVILDVAAWAIPLGLAGALVHALLIRSRHDFSHLPDLWHTAVTWDAAIGVPGAVALGCLGAWIACRRAGDVKLGEVAGAAAPAVAFGLAVGGLGNYWAQTFYGRPSSLLWAVRISPEHRVAGYENYATFQPAFLYQSLWDVAVGFAVIWAARRLMLSGERTFMLFAALYAVGSFWVEMIRVGPLPQALGMRTGDWGNIVVFAAAAVGLYLTRPKQAPGKPARPAVGEPTLVDD